MSQTECKSNLLAQRDSITHRLRKSPYDPIIYLERATIYLQLNYPDLAVGDAHRALNLTDEALNESYEYHKHVTKSLQRYADSGTLPSTLKAAKLEAELKGHDDKSKVEQLATMTSIRCVQILSRGLWILGCLQKAAIFCQSGLTAWPDNEELKCIIEKIRKTVARRLKREDAPLSVYPDWGLARREVYPWNGYEPDRSLSESLSRLNEELKRMAPKCEVKRAELPILEEGKAKLDASGKSITCFQLGVFATEDIAAGEAVLKEYSLLTASNRLKESICDACSSELPELKENSKAINCHKCYDTVFCDQFCFEKAQEKYHPAVCEKDIDSIGRDVDAHEADEALHLLLLGRVLAMATHQKIHPLDVLEVKYIWGDFVASEYNDVDDAAEIVENTGLPPKAWSLPFNFNYNIEMPLHILEKMDVDIFGTLDNHDLWVFNSLYSKTRGTASARKNSRDGRPEVAAIHPFWCLANHDCDPNVTWEWGGRMTLWAREKRVVADRQGGIKAGEEILNHYCDINLPVLERREWACGSLGGWCMCLRCKREAGESW